MKRVLSIMLAVLMVAAVFAGCSKNDNNSSSVVEPPVSTLPEESSNNLDNSESGLDNADATLLDVHKGIKEAYGDAYVPSMSIDATMLSEVYGVNADNVESFIAEGPMMSTHVDTYISIKAKEGKGEEVEKELNTYRDSVVSNSLQYPMNVEKVNASKVTRQGDYVFFVMLGGFGEDLEEGADMVKYAEEQTKIALDKIAEFFK